MFVDTGGDSLVLKLSDVAEGAQETHPMEGDDTLTLSALSSLSDTYLAVLAPGLDIRLEGFMENVELLRERGGYFGRVNLRTGEQDGFTLSHIFPYSAQGLGLYREVAGRTLILEEEHLTQPDRFVSFTGSVLWNTLHQRYGMQRSFAHWAKDPVLVTPEQSWAYFFYAKAAHDLRVELNSS